MQMKELVAFDAPTSSEDAYGGKEDGWTEQFREYADFRYLRGGETVQAARLTGRQPVVATLWSSATARTITTQWRMRDLRRGVIYNIRSVIPIDEKGLIEVTAESGVAGTTASDWILENGVWNDAGIWVDSDVWNDAA